MVEAVENRRGGLPSNCCAWCKQIWTGTGWDSERRHAGSETYSHGICAECRSIVLREGRRQPGLKPDRARKEAKGRTEAGRTEDYSH